MTPLPLALLDQVENVVRKAPAKWLVSVCETLRSLPPATTCDLVIQRMPETHNADLAHLMAEVLRHSPEHMSWEALSWAVSSMSAAHRRQSADQGIEVLWAGPSPAGQAVVRRIDQVLYDLIASAEREILLVTFAAAKIDRLTTGLLAAANRGVQIRLILEFAEASEGQLSFDALNAFPPALIAGSEIYLWPVNKRERNARGNPGKLHAKVAVVDSTAIVSSANLTDDAFSRNLEMGVRFADPQTVDRVKAHFKYLIDSHILERWEP